METSDREKWLCIARESHRIKRYGIPVFSSKIISVGWHPWTICYEISTGYCQQQIQSLVQTKRDAQTSWKIFWRVVQNKSQKWRIAERKYCSESGNQSPVDHFPTWKWSLPFQQIMCRIIFPF